MSVLPPEDAPTLRQMTRRKLIDSDDDDPEYMTPAQLQAHAKRIEMERRRAREAKEAQRST